MFGTDTWRDVHAHTALSFVSRDCKWNNILMDSAPIQISSVHPFSPSHTHEFTADAQYSARTRNPVKYYWINFDLSGEHDLMKGPPLIVPRYSGAHPRVPFRRRIVRPVYCGCLVSGQYDSTKAEPGLCQQPQNGGFHFLDGLVADMTSGDPAKRPSMGDVVNHFSEITAGLSQWKLRS
ncbi:hypothetical protein B0H17DRAFT_1145735 [Mycena rosella]|uniref:Protein kinase domain-containing protein n=1 Tax=Mycena rosella TaxID=1033263 RepID=A0AAD7CQE8_MYCRO|nr:hypothetical protein B0H17DRAFT_1145735 [Mycena rosella]